MRSTFSLKAAQLSSASKVTAVEDVSREDVQSRDEMVLARFGKKQQLNRRFGWMAITGLTCTFMLTWEGSVISFGPQLLNGGPAGTVGGFLFAWMGTILQCLVMCEMASAVPLSGGQYNWIAVMAPPSCAKFLSYIGGWVTLVAWHSGAASVLFLDSSIIQTLAALSHPSYVPERWHVTLIMYGLVALGFLINTYLCRMLSKFEAAILLLHIFGFFVVLIVLVYLTPAKLPAEEVFGTYVNGGGWSSNSLSFLVGSIGSMYSFGGLDSAAHLSEEVRNASKVVPASMLATVIFNGAAGFGMILAMLFCMGSLDDVIQSVSSGGLPFASIFVTATGSTAGAVGLAVIPALVGICGGIGAVAAASRMVWAFARENALPGSRYLAKVNERTALPLNAILFTAAVNLLLALVNIGSTVAFNALAGLVIQGFYSVFLLAASVMLHKRLTTPQEHIPWGPFRLGRAGVPITILAIVYSIVGFIFSFWPPVVNPGVAMFNWATVVYVGTLSFALAYWFLWARRTYTGPILENQAEDSEHSASRGANESK